MGTDIRRGIKKDWGVGIPEYTDNDLMTKEEVHDFALEIVFGFIREDKYEILNINLKYGMNPSFIGKKNDEVFAFIVKSDIAPNHPVLSQKEKFQLIQFCTDNELIPIFCPVSFGATDPLRFEKSIALIGDSFYCNFKGFENIITD